jgi:peptidyl-prolyl cis-trans isomerase B (cyclophilin B)
VHQIERQIAANKVDMSKTAWRTALAKPAVVTLKANKSYSAHMKTNKGRVVIKLMPDVAPMHVTSFMYLTQLDFDDGLKFHRVIQGIMAQGGCPLGTGTGGPVYQFEGEYSPT